MFWFLAWICSGILLSVLQTLGITTRSIGELCERGDVKGLLHRIKGYGEDINEKDLYDRVPLITAIERNHLGCVQVLLDQPTIELNRRDCTGKPALCAAIQYASDELVEIMIAHPNIRVNCEDTLHGWTPLHYACKYKRTDVIRKLLLVPEINPNVQDLQRKWAPVHLPQNTCDSMSALLQSNKVDPNLQDIVGRTPLHLACQRGYSGIVSVLLSHPEIKPSIKDKDNHTLLYCTCTMKQSTEIIEMLFSQDYQPTWAEVETVLHSRDKWSHSLNHVKIAYCICLLGNFQAESFFSHDDPFLHNILQYASSFSSKSARKTVR